MEFTAPVSSGFTVYGKTDCPYCLKVKDLLAEYNEPMTYVNCDPYLVEKEEFLAFIKAKAGKEHKTFPMVFSDGKFVGGYTDTIQFLLKKYD